MNYNEKLKKIYLHHGTKEQQDHLKGELKEFFQAVNEYIDKPTFKTRNHMEEEFADVQVMLSEFKLIFGLNKKNITKWMKYKIDRQCRRDKITI